MPPRPLLVSLSLILATMAAGIAVRLAPLGLPAAVVKYAGSMLWAAMTYWIASTIFASLQPGIVALAAGFLAAIVELFKLYHTSALDAFRLTLPGILLLGRFFSLRDIAAYWIAISVAAMLDAHFFRRRPIAASV